MVNLTIRSKNFEFNNVSAIIFDKDGTLTDSHIYWAEIIRRRTIAIQEEFNIDSKYFELIANSMGLDIKRNSLLTDGPIAIKSRKEVIENLFKNIVKLNHKITVQAVSNIFSRIHNTFQDTAINYIKPIEEACQFVKTCEVAKIRLALVTSDTKNNADIAIRRIGLESMFEIIIGGDCKLGAKSTGDPARFVCKTMGLSPNQVLAIGDAPMDYEMALNSDLLGSIIVATGQIPIDDLLKLTPCCVNSLAELYI